MKKNVKIISVIVVALIVVVGVAYLATRQKSSVTKNTGDNNKVNVKVGEKMSEKQSEEAKKETKKIIEETIKDKGEEAVEEIAIANPEGEGEEGEEGEKPATIKVVKVADGTNAINIDTGEVVNEQGEAVKNDAEGGTAEAPSESYPITDEKDIPASAIRLKVTSSSFTPNTFTVKRGQVVTLAVTNVNTGTGSERFKFDDPSLKGVYFGISKGTTKVMVFNAPTKPGEYVFYSNMFNHRALGAEGKMIVK